MQRVAEHERSVAPSITEHSSNDSSGVRFAGHRSDHHHEHAGRLLGTVCQAGGFSVGQRSAINSHVSELAVEVVVRFDTDLQRLII